VAVAGLLAGGGIAAVPSHATGSIPTWQGSLTRHTYGTPGADGSRDYLLYAPPGPAVAGRPVIVYLHGCTQTADDAAVGTRFNQLADEKNFLVVYPEQRATSGTSAPLADGNGTACWNWFLPQDQVRDQGEPAAIAGITREVLASTQGDADRVYVEGASAGADMATIMGAAYPDLYAAIGVLAGCAYATCTDLDGSQAYAAMGANHRVVPVFNVQGTSDALNNYAMGRQATIQWLGTDDLADDGVANGSVAQTAAATETHGFDQTPSPGSGDPCVRNHQFPCAGGVIGFQGTYPYNVEHFADSQGCDLAQLWTVHGLAHGYAGGDPAGTFTDPLGPDITTAAYNFFLAHPRSGGCPALP
jgi:poly(hydroxyalkanoate) depolymerase family esterase